MLGHTRRSCWAPVPDAFRAQNASAAAMITAVLVAVGVLAFTLVVALLIAWSVGGQAFWSRNPARHDDDWQLLGER
jgi:formate hydrogenlyase subunit 3/multisubunit Na+/H+ antiporter MnhD subunit